MQPQMQQARMPYVRFETRVRTREDADGHKIHDQIDYALITPVGTKDCVERVVADWFKYIRQQVQAGRFEMEWLEKIERMYKIWQETNSIPLDGTPIANWPVATKAQAQICRAINVHTVEDLAVANEETLGRIGMGARDLQRRAKDWITAEQGNAPLVSQLSALRTKCEDLERKVKELQTENETLHYRLNKQPTAAEAAPQQIPKSFGPADTSMVGANARANADEELDRILG